MASLPSEGKTMSMETLSQQVRAKSKELAQDITKFLGEIPPLEIEKTIPDLPALDQLEENLRQTENALKEATLSFQKLRDRMRNNQYQEWGY